MKIYRAWTDSNHKITYTLGYFEDRQDAVKSLDILGGRDAGSPDYGVEEIDITPRSQPTPSIEVDEHMPKGEIRFEDRGGKVLGKIVNIKEG